MDARHGRPDVEIDRLVGPEEAKARGRVEPKLLVVWRPDEPADRRIAAVEEFVVICQDAGLISIIEPVARQPCDGRTWHLDAGIQAAARELGSLGADLYKGQVPTHGYGEEPEMRRGCERMAELISSPWVVLSSGVPRDLFPRAVEIACRAGAFGFLAGKAVWSNAIGVSDAGREVGQNSCARLRQLAEIVDGVVASGGAPR